MDELQNDLDNSKEFTCISLCTGYGGIEIGLKRVVPTLRTIVYVERECYPVANLVAKIEAGQLDAAPIWTDIKTFDGKPFRNKVHLITSGFPCQPFSVAGKRGGGTDERHLWPYIEGIIKAVRPVWCFFENVPGLLSARTLDNRPDLCRYLANLATLAKIAPTAKKRWHLSEHIRRLTGYLLRTEGIPAYSSIYFSLRSMGYSVEAGLFSAAEVGAPHRRERLFILAHNENSGFARSNLPIRQSQRQRQATINFVRISESQLAHTSTQRLQKPTCRKLQSLPGQADEAEGSNPCGIYAETRWPSRPGQPQYEWEEPRTIMGRLNPDWVENLMGIPCNWTNPLYNGTKNERDSNGNTNQATEKKLSVLREQVGTKEIQRKIRGLQGISETEVLQSPVLCLRKNSNKSKQEHIKKKSIHNKDESMREVREQKQSSTSPRGLQSTIKGNGIMSKMPHRNSCSKRKLGKDTKIRIDRLRLLGNGCVPQQVELAWRILWQKHAANAEK